MSDRVFPNPSALFSFSEPKQADKDIFISGPIDLAVDYDDVDHEAVLRDVKKTVIILNSHWPVLDHPQDFYTRQTSIDLVTSRLHRRYADKGRAWAIEVAHMAEACWGTSMASAACCELDQYLAAHITAKYRYALAVSLEMARVALTVPGGDD